MAIAATTQLPSQARLVQIRSVDDVRPFCNTIVAYTTDSKNFGAGRQGKSYFKNGFYFGYIAPHHSLNEEHRGFTMTRLLRPQPRDWFDQMMSPIHCPMTNAMFKIDSRIRMRLASREELMLLKRIVKPNNHSPHFGFIWANKMPSMIHNTWVAHRKC